MEDSGWFVVWFWVDEPWVRKGLKFGFSRFGPGFGPFLAEQVQSLGFLEGFERVQSLVLLDEPGFE